MKAVPVQNLEVGVPISKDIFNESGNIILASGTNIEKRHIDYFLSHDIQVVYIDETGELEVDIKKDATEQYYNIKEMYQHALDEAKKVHAIAMQDDVNDIDFKAVQDVLEPLVSELLKDNDVLRTLRIIGTSDSYIYTHYVNVSLLSAMLAKWYGLDDKQQRLMSFCGFFHDIGKARVPQELLFKADPLTTNELSTVKSHAMKGYEILKQVFATYDHPEFEPLEINEILNATISHHERANGSGYPFNLKDTSIPLCAKIVSVVDVYDAITSNRHYRDGISPYVAFKLLKEESFKGLDPKLSQLFLKNISQFFINNKVRLSDGRIGEVVYVNKFALNRPLVKVSDEFIDLSMNYSIDITEVIF